MTLEQTRLVTGDVATLTRFYEGVSQGKAAIINSGYVEFHSEPCGGLAIVGPVLVAATGGAVHPQIARRCRTEHVQWQDVSLRDVGPRSRSRAPNWPLLHQSSFERLCESDVSALPVPRCHGRTHTAGSDKRHSPARICPGRAIPPLTTTGSPRLTSMSNWTLGGHFI